MVTPPLVLRFVPALGATAVVGLVGATRPLGATARAIAIGCLVVSWGTAALLERRRVRSRATVVAAIGAVTAAGQVDAGLPYGAACAVLLLASFSSMRAARVAGSSTGGADARAPARSTLTALVLLAGVTAAVTASLVVGMPRVAARIEQRISAMLGVDGEEATAFSTTMVLGSTRGMLQSDAIVMRIEGPRPEYLRGAVYDRYAPPYWIMTEHGGRRHSVAAAGSRATATTHMALVRGAPEGNDMRWFLPAGACDLRVASGSVEIDAFGVARRARGDSPPTLSLRTGDCEVPPAPVLPPTPIDLDVPEAARRSLAPVAAGWTASAPTAQGKLEAISRELGRFEYSLAVPRTSGVDPVVDFVTVHRAGHCEMFASAMVLMARTQGIPARVVGGYRVTEVNPITGRAVVRDRDAHAWVEAWVDGAWRGWDPTPASESFGRGAGALDHAGDLVAIALERVVAALTALGLLGTAGVLAGVAAVLAGARWLGGRVRARRRRLRGAQTDDRPLPCFDRLTDALAGAGHARDESEPLEAFARRLATVDARWAGDASEALLGYARHRYGGLGDEASVVRSIERAARAVRAGSP